MYHYARLIGRPWNIPEVRAMFGEYENEIREIAEFSIFYIPALLRAKYAAK